MPRWKSFEVILDEADKIDRVWDANPTFALGDLTREKFKEELSALREKRGELEEAKRQVTNLTNLTNEKAESVTANITRALSGIRAVFGPDSTQYEEAGGTRSSERKSPKTKKGGNS